MPTDARPQPSEVTPQEARMLAVQYRQMAETVTTAPARRLLLRLAQFLPGMVGRDRGITPFFP
jgi:hypothetical protein